MATLATHKSLEDLEKNSEIKEARLSSATASTAAETNPETNDSSKDVNTPSTPSEKNAFEVGWDGPSDPENPQVRPLGIDRYQIAQLLVTHRTGAEGYGGIIPSSRVYWFSTPLLRAPHQVVSLPPSSKRSDSALK